MSETTFTLPATYIVEHGDSALAALQEARNKRLDEVLLEHYRNWHVSFRWPWQRKAEPEPDDVALRKAKALLETGQLHEPMPYQVAKEVWNDRIQRIKVLLVICRQSPDGTTVTLSLPDASFFTEDKPASEWSGSPDPDDPDNFWINDETGERVSVDTGERSRKL